MWFIEIFQKAILNYFILFVFYYDNFVWLIL